MPKIDTPNRAPAIRTAAAAHHYRFVGIEVTARGATRSTGPYSDNNVVYLESGGGQTSPSQVPTEIIFDRCYIHGTPTGSVRRGIAMNGARMAAVDPYLSDFHEVGADSQAISGWNGPGPFKIVNNHLEGEGGNLMFGGADPSIPDLIPSDIEIRGNHFFKPLSWKIGHPTYAGTPWSVKNLFELKNARRVLAEGNLLEHNWQHDQNGFAILFTVRNQDGGARWSTVEDVTFRKLLSGDRCRGRLRGPLARQLPPWPCQSVQERRNRRQGPGGGDRRARGGDGGGRLRRLDSR
jgi:hypothetical protein